MNLNNIISKLNNVLPQMQNIIINDNAFHRYILPAIIAGGISILGMFINSYISVWSVNKKRSQEYGKFYLPYLVYLKDIQIEIECFLYTQNNMQNNIWLKVIECAALQNQENDIHLNKIIESLEQIKSLFELKTYYIINKSINSDILDIQTFISCLDKCLKRSICPNELEVIKSKVKTLTINIENHIKEIESHS